MARGQAIDARWGDLVNPKPGIDSDDDPEEIKNRIMTGLKGLSE